MKPGWIRRGGYITADRVPFNPLLPLKLRNRVSGKSDRDSGGACCLQELSILLGCLKKHDFQDVHCPTEIANFQKCYSNHCQQMIRKKEMKDSIGAYEKRLTPQQADRLLQKFPT